VLQHIVFVAYLVGAATLFALLEIQIEGSAGWATGLPTWRWETRWTRWLLGNRAITGYHLYIHLFVTLLAHLPYALGIADFSIPTELRILGFLALFWVLEDFLWFVLNPAYRLAGFRRERVPWHAESWWLFMPRDYWFFVPLGIVLYVAGSMP